MPNCFTLTRKSNLEAGPVALQVIDSEMCAHFKVPCDEVRYHHSWFDTIGFALATGKSWTWMREKLVHQLSEPNNDLSDWDKHTLEIVDWLEANFTPDAWAEVGKRR